MLDTNTTDKTYFGDVMTNCDHTINEEIADKIKNENGYGGYAAWEFHGTIYYEDGKYHCDVKRYRVYKGTYSHETLQGIMEEVSNKYGWE